MTSTEGEARSARSEPYEKPHKTHVHCSHNTDIICVSFAQKLGGDVSDKERSINTVNSRIGDILTDQQSLRSRCEDDLERMKGQLRQHRAEMDDVRRQASVVGDLQGAMSELNGNQGELAQAVS